jgi:probable phosphoglycerate mutase
VAKRTFITVYFDGAGPTKADKSGPAAIGVVAFGAEGKVFTISKHIGMVTHHEAEYRAAIEGLRKARKLGYGLVHLVGDSKLVVGHVTGASEVKMPKLLPLKRKLRWLLDSFTWSHVTWLPREFNAAADRLARVKAPQLESSKARASHD